MSSCSSRPASNRLRRASIQPTYPKRLTNVTP
ncbi:DUF3678 domain-containing protein [Deinococcus radiodurans R1 = ATCC 13939 = DSM 20539]|nr:DUF3678 domain-containing protein [Deinococcus radiodurans]UDL01644.1 DUF3678 domain-containing protein [Deinococcus radiodurans R1 = ATCC 13939 = DSM 20539]HCE65104.1 hypothetical protein [Deinococcus radiodurans]